MNVVTIESIPEELLLDMFGSFDLEDILKLSLISKFFCKLSNNDKLWIYTFCFDNKQFTSKSKKDYIDFIELKIFVKKSTIGVSNFVKNSITEVTNFDVSGYGSINSTSKLIDKIPKKITIFAQLKTIKLCYTIIKEIPNELFDLKDLEIICFSGNQIKEIPASIKNAKKLKELTFSSGFIDNFPKELCLLQNLQKLNLHFNKITKLPDDIGLLTNLETLILDFNQITSIPSSISNLVKLKELSLGMNFIEILPKELGELKLRKLDIKDNKISIIPWQICASTIDIYCDSNVINFKKMPIIGSFFGL